MCFSNELLIAFTYLNKIVYFFKTQLTTNEDCINWLWENGERDRKNRS